MKRNHRSPVRRPMRSRYRNTGPSVEIVDLVLERAQYSCELDGAQIGDRRGVDFHVHHRRPRRMGGSQLPDTNAPQNVLILCPDDHAMVESERTAAYAGGWLVPQGSDPLVVPVLIVAQLTHLTAEGGYERCPVGCAACGRTS